MISFETDYIEGCHEEILKALIRTNMVQEPGYGADQFSKSAAEKIRRACSCPEADVYFLSGGTQTNQLVIDTMLQPYEGVISAESGHVSVHEAGAIEFSGHKVLTVPEHEGKVDAQEVEAYVRRFYLDGNHEHMVFPGMLYISHPTEYGTLYTADELRELSRICHENHMALYLDGARLGYGLAAKNTDVTLPLIAELTDAFYIGGTKVGALNGEALVFTRQNTPSHFPTRIKQHGALLAKGRLIGLQFDTLFTPVGQLPDTNAPESQELLYTHIGGHAIRLAERLKEIFHKMGLTIYLESPTNQQFIIVDNTLLEELQKEVRFSFWDTYDETHTVIRFVTDWATRAESLDALEDILARTLQK